MFKKLLLECLYTLSQYKYWIVLLSLLVIGYSYHKVDKSSEYVSGVEFVYYGVESNLSVEIGDIVLYKGKEYIIDEQILANIINAIIENNSKDFKTIATSKHFFYKMLLERRFINNDLILVGNYIIELLQDNDLVLLQNSEIENLTFNEKATLKYLYGLLEKNTNLTSYPDVKSFTITTRSKNKDLAAFLSTVYYEYLIEYLEDAKDRKLVLEYNRSKSRTDSLLQLFSEKEYQYWASMDKYANVNDNVSLIPFEILEQEKTIREREFYLSQSNFRRIEQSLQNRNSNFFLINRLFIPIEIQSDWIKNFFILSVLGLLLCYFIILTIGFLMVIFSENFVQEVKITSSN